MCNLASASRHRSTHLAKDDSSSKTFRPLESCSLWIERGTWSSRSFRGRVVRFQGSGLALAPTKERNVETVLYVSRPVLSSWCDFSSRQCWPRHFSRRGAESHGGGAACFFQTRVGTLDRLPASTSRHKRCGGRRTRTFTLLSLFYHNLEKIASTRNTKGAAAGGPEPLPCTPCSAVTGC